MSKWLIGVLVALGVLALAAGGMYLKMSSDAKAALAALPYESIDMNRVSDGVFLGESDAGLVRVKVEVAVKDHKMEAVKILEHQNGRGGAAEAIVEKMVAQNRYDVDAVSGATLSSQTIKSAVSLALKQGQP
jgi:uncharacterized protein with FMN-binding domain